METIQRYVPENVNILVQGEIVAEKLVDYLHRHPEMEKRISKNGTILYQTTESAENFEGKAALFMGHAVKAEHVHF